MLDGLLVFMFYIIVIVCMVSGLMLCKYFAFREGVIFFSILLILKLLSVPYTLTLQQLVTHLYSNNSSPPFGWTMGQFIQRVSSIPAVFELIAYIILVAGLYRLWKLKKQSQA